MKIGDKLYVRGDGRAYMEVTIDRIEGGQVYGLVTWATIAALRYHCSVSDVEQQGDRLVVDHGFSARANVNVPMFLAPLREGRE